VKRNLQLIFEILRYFEEEGKPGTHMPRPEISGHDKNVVNCHVDLCAEAGFIRFKTSRMPGHLPETDKIEALTWKGHEFLEDWRSRS